MQTQTLQITLGSGLVPSQSGKGHYEVSLRGRGPNAATCSCPDYEDRGEPCKHVYAVQYAIRREMAVSSDGSLTLTESVTLTETTTVASRPTYKQNWPAWYGWTRQALG